MVWITRLQPFDLKILHRPGKHYSHADGLSWCTSRPCKLDTCHECVPLLHQVTPEEDMVGVVTPSYPYLEHFNGYIEMFEVNSSLFHDPPVSVPTSGGKSVSPN